MKTISFLSVLSGLLLVTTMDGYASTTVDPQILILNNKMSVIFQPLQGEESKVLVKFKDDTESTLLEMKVDANKRQRQAINFSQPQPGIYYIDIFHNRTITRKELVVRWNSVEVVRITKTSNETFHF
ncbi:MAG: hypothetical protein AAGE93_13275 [Bacteroidota bacterium]